MTDTTDDLQPALARWSAQPFAYLTTAGRHSGTPHRIEIWFAVDDGCVYLLSGGRDRSDWVCNLQADPAVSIELGSETFAGTARTLAPETPEDRHARALLVEKYRKANELDEWGRTSLPIVVKSSSIKHPSDAK